ncbi:uncharacterized protein RCC_01790 [Ramularia collo-cygni]|uniref:Uncharacterized protein n=1 Tax=Ramularia collo-cygni TaxID=112498 RepID=A0A2D3UN08_9PEZI|nr:uncharacterized protein RCC_01790 [Ramularia collo-cygni]CZT15951.1 uncharacterized protein RCC_01790 [Ramularia collo-cygni]
MDYVSLPTTWQDSPAYQAYLSLDRPPKNCPPFQSSTLDFLIRAGEIWCRQQFDGPEGLCAKRHANREELVAHINSDDGHAPRRAIRLSSNLLNDHHIYFYEDLMKDEEYQDKGRTEAGGNLEQAPAVQARPLSFSTLVINGKRHTWASREENRKKRKVQEDVPLDEEDNLTPRASSMRSRLECPNFTAPQAKKSDRPRSGQQSGPQIQEDPAGLIDLTRDEDPEEHETRVEVLAAIDDMPGATLTPVSMQMEHAQPAEPLADPAIQRPTINRTNVQDSDLLDKQRRRRVQLDLQYQVYQNRLQALELEQEIKEHEKKPRAPVE